MLNGLIERALCVFFGSGEQYYCFQKSIDHREEIILSIFDGEGFKRIQVDGKKETCQSFLSLLITGLINFSNYLPHKEF